MKILLVEDDAVSQQYIKILLLEIFAAKNVEIVATKRAREAVELAQKTTFDLLVLDSVLEDTIDLQDTVKRMATVVVAVPTIVVTEVHVDRAMAEEAVAAGVKTYVEKSTITENSLKAFVEHALSSGETDRLDVAITQQATATEELRKIALEMAKKLLTGVFADAGLATKE